MVLFSLAISCRSSHRALRVALYSGFSPWRFLQNLWVRLAWNWVGNSVVIWRRGISSSESGSGVSSGCGGSAAISCCWSSMGGVEILVVDLSCKKNKNKTPVSAPIWGQSWFRREAFSRVSRLVRWGTDVYDVKHAV